MSNITMAVVSDRPSHYAKGTVAVGTEIQFQILAQYHPQSANPGLAYPWVTCIVGKEHVPQRFTTYEGALNEVKTLTLRQFDLATQEKARSRVNAELETMVEELTQ